MEDGFVLRIVIVLRPFEMYSQWYSIYVRLTFPRNYSNVERVPSMHALHTRACYIYALFHLCVTHEIF